MDREEARLHFRAQDVAARMFCTQDKAGSVLSAELLALKDDASVHPDPLERAIRIAAYRSLIMSYYEQFIEHEVAPATVH